jgi:hypothetical protein
MSVDRIIQAESGGNPYAKNPRSSATGAGQFIDSTWLSMIGKYRPDLAEGKSKAEILALRTDPELSRAMTEAYAAENAGVLGQAGFRATPGNTYLAHFAGPQGAVKILGADPSASVASIMGDAAVRANPFLANMTAGDLINWAGRKMGGASAPQVAPQSPPWSPPQQQAQQQAPQGLFANLATPSRVGGVLPYPDQQQMPMLQPVSIPTPPKRQIDLTKLRALASRYV